MARSDVSKVWTGDYTSQLTAQVSVTTSATLLKAADSNYPGVTVKNTHTTSTLYLGAAGVTNATGFALAPGEALSLDFAGALYGVASTGTLTAHVHQVGY